MPGAGSIAELLRATLQALIYEFCAPCTTRHVGPDTQLYKVCIAISKTNHMVSSVSQMQVKASAARERSDALRERVETIQALNAQIQLNAVMAEVVQSAVRPDSLCFVVKRAPLDGRFRPWQVQSIAASESI